jgi:hypothetical protein
MPFQVAHTIHFNLDVADDTNVGSGPRGRVTQVYETRQSILSRVLYDKKRYDNRICIRKWSSQTTVKTVAIG